MDQVRSTLGGIYDELSGELKMPRDEVKQKILSWLYGADTPNSSIPFVDVVRNVVRPVTTATHYDDRNIPEAALVLFSVDTLDEMLKDLSFHSEDGENVGDLIEAVSKMIADKS